MLTLRASAVAGALVVALALAGCTPASELVEGSSVTVAVSQQFTSFNPNTAYGAVTDTNRAIFQATHSGFFAYDETPELVADASFGSYEVVSSDPLVVTYTVNSGVRWSDGVPIDAADLLLAWAANSGSVNDADFDPAGFVDPRTGQFTEQFPRAVVYFDGFSGNGLQLVSQTPVVGADGRSITLIFDEYFADWKLIFDVGLPAHIVAEQALRVAEPAEAKEAMTAAIVGGDRRALARLSRAWNTGFTIPAEGQTTESKASESDASENGAAEREGSASDGETADGEADDGKGAEVEAEAEAEAEISVDHLVSSGPYRISAVKPGDGVTLEVNPEYQGAHLPRYEEIVVRVISDPLQAVAALNAGEVDVIAPQPTPDVVDALAELDDVTVERGFSGMWERVDLQHSGSRNGHIENLLVRRAFMKTIPREQILDDLIRPLNSDAVTRDSQVFLPGTEGYEAAVPANGSRAYDRVDIPAAKQLIAKAVAEAGIPAKPQICLLFDPANPRRVAEFQLIRDSAAEADIVVTNCSSPDWRNLLGTPQSYDAALYSLGETNLSLAAVSASFSSDSQLNNFSHYSSDAADALIARAATPASPPEESSDLGSTREKERAEGLQALVDLDRLLWTDAVGMPLYQFPTLTAVSPNVLGVSRSPFEQAALWSPWNWGPRPAPEPTKTGK